MNWFKRHLNGTIILTVCVQYVISFIGLYVERNTAAYIYQSIIGWIALALTFPIFAWILSQKGHSAWLLYLNFVPLGWIAFIVLGKKEAA